MDPRMISEVGGDLLLTRITRPHKAVAVGFGPTMFKEIDKGSLIVVDNVLLETLRYTEARAVEDGTFHGCGVVLLIDEEVLSSDALLRSLWASTTVLLKPWNGGLARAKDGNLATAAITDLAARIDLGLRTGRIKSLTNDCQYRDTLPHLVGVYPNFPSFF